MSCKKTYKLCQRKRRSTINQQPSLPLYTIINTDTVNSNISVQIQIGYSSNQFSKKSQITNSNKIATTVKFAAQVNFNLSPFVTLNRA